MLRRIFILTLAVGLALQTVAESKATQEESKNDLKSMLHRERLLPMESPQVRTEPIIKQPDRWRKYVSWPEGITAWAIILTLGAIVWQAYETRRAANAANRTLASTLRPRLVLRRITFHCGTYIPTLGLPDEDPWRVNFELANVGEGAAHISDYAFAVSRIEGDLPTEISYMEEGPKPKPFSLEAGEVKDLYINIDQALVDMLRLIGPSGLSRGDQRTDQIYFFGNARYTDDLGVKRSMGVCRHYDNASKRFKPIDNPDREY